MNRTQEVQSEEYVYLQLRNGRARMHAHETSKDNTDIPLQPVHYTANDGAYNAAHRGSPARVEVVAAAQ